MFYLSCYRKTVCQLHLIIANENLRVFDISSYKNGIFNMRLIIRDVKKFAEFNHQVISVEIKYSCDRIKICQP